jgi:hypothetical protein
MMRKFGTVVTQNEPVTGEQAVTVRPASTAVLAIDSADRYPTYQEDWENDTTPYEFTITRNQAILNGFFTRIALTEFVFPFYLPNINTYTNTLYFKKNGGATASGNIPIGFYTPTALAAAVQTMLQANGFATATVVYQITPANNVPPCSFLIDTNSADSIQFVRGAGGSPASTDTTLERFQLFDLMRLDGLDAGLVGGRTTQCKYIEYIDIVCTQLTYNQDLKDSSSAPNSRDVLARIYIETENDQPGAVYQNGAFLDVANTIPGTYPFTIYRQFKTPKQILWNKAQSLGNIKFELFDNNGQPLSAPFTAGAAGSAVVTGSYPDWRMTLLVSEN